MHLGNLLVSLKARHREEFGLEQRLADMAICDAEASKKGKKGPAFCETVAMMLDDGLLEMGRLLMLTLLKIGCRLRRCLFL
jgi:hypothetical protein